MSTVSSTSLPSFSPIRRAPQVSASVANEIMRRILEGSLGVGERLPSEAELARDFDVSRPSVREALAALQFAGHVETRRGYGTVVISAHATIGGLVMRRHRGELQTLDDVVDLLETRLILEPYALETAARCPDLAALDEAGEIIAGMRLAVGDAQLRAVTDLQAHRALLNVCQNIVLRESTLQLLDLALHPMLSTARTKAWSTPEMPNRWADHHELVYQAIRTGDANGARLGSVTHLQSVAKNVHFTARERPDLKERIDRLTEGFDI